MELSYAKPLIRLSVRTQRHNRTRIEMKIETESYEEEFYTFGLKKIEFITILYTTKEKF